ncbi:MAG: DUF3990 domain-containing protein [Desulfovibrio sp.]|nr:DUF3990 domain-containing protein [Desulfovibrio sp.]
MRLYHGSSNIITAPQWKGGDENNDYGNGFYTTNRADLACEWAVKPGQDGYLNIYELDTKGLKFVDLNQECYTALNWMALLYRNRRINGMIRHQERVQLFLEKFLPDISKADVVIGHRADDRYFRIGKFFIRNDLPLSDLEEALLLGNLGQQIFLQSEEVFSSHRLKFLGYECVQYKEWYQKREKRENKAMKFFEKIENKARKKGEITIEDILENEGWIYARPASELSHIKIHIPDDCIVIKAPFQADTMVRVCKK